MKPTPITEYDHVDGPSDARVALIEYSDFECPFCVRAYPIIQDIRESYRGRLRFVYRHVPKSRAENFTKQAAEASEFAGAAGQFWSMHVQLFTHPDRHGLDHLVEYAAAVGLDPEACRTALVERRFAERVRELAVAAIRSGIIGTPTLFINDARYEDRVEEEPLQAAIEQAFG